ncbi:MAG: hypothetical protein ACT4PJ_03955 [Gemmatimonadaceae bacterium]
MNVQPRTLAHHAFVAAASALARSVWVIQPYIPFVGLCLRAEERLDRVADFFRFGRCFDPRDAFFLVVMRVRLGCRNIVAHECARKARRTRDGRRPSHMIVLTPTLCPAPLRQELPPYAAATRRFRCIRDTL